jgi:hypothetical protein
MKTKEKQSVWNDTDARSGEKAVRDGKFKVEGGKKGRGTG